ncbi:unnamed protein product (macronuclear) [Paramecium tetraurelia]|uniref:RING-type domain-containing protein n=1 Tax=Paramecium tetraurelia TaxID=5888 RepID=A0DGL7_PARTE|nr:uncharacterized protein GSPATT00002313001 [Paramecium tetraurelia]CAK82184.1 unnamed protein product [Paramecium tetraurelia]|eukprot:XP_001449581.1 hypothetical protein (macronuclear) [Paramecium tetraurelia strain d4-2]
MAEITIVEEQQDAFEFDDEFDFENLEMPQLVRRNGIIHTNEEIMGYYILDKPAEKIFEEEQCPICLESSEQLYPLKCGHTYCQYDIEKMMEISKSSYGLLQCPICRAYQTLDSFDEVTNVKQGKLENCQQACH